MHYAKRSGLIGLLVGLVAVSALAEEAPKMDQWRGCTVAEADFQKKLLPPGVEWLWVGHPSNSFKAEKLFAHAGPIAYYMHFPMKPLSETAHPLLLLNGLPEGSVVLLQGKPLTQTNQRQKGSDEFSIERWYQLPEGTLKTGEKELNRLEVWVPSIRKSLDATVAPVSVIVLDDPDVLVERERQRKLRQPYLHEVDETEDPYVARHW